MNFKPNNNQIELSIVMPCLNEAETLRSCIDKARKFIIESDVKAEIIVADNGSSDGSREIALNSGAKLIGVQERGYGAALRAGISAAEGEFVVMGDADDSYDFSSLSPFMSALREGFDLVMGCRFPSGGGKIEKGAMPIKHRLLGNPVLSFIGRLFFKSPVKDFHCGLRGFRRDAFGRMGLRTTGMEFASEMVMKATMLGLRITEVPITLHKDGRSRPPHLRSWRDGWRHLRFMLMYCPKWLFFVPGNIVFWSSLIFFLLLLKSQIQFGGIVLDTNTLLVAALGLLVGFQIIMFGFFTKTFALTEKLIPEDSKMMKWFSVISLEIGILAGVIILLIGGCYLGFAFFSWYKNGFGGLSYPMSLRKIIPAVTCIVLGVQIIFSSFFMSILGLRRS